MSDMPLSERIGPNLPFLRRYARALTGSQARGDGYAIATLEAVLADPEKFSAEMGPKAGLFRVFHAIWASTGSQVAPELDMDGLEDAAQAHLARLTPNTREALLLHTLEGFEMPQVAHVMGIDADEAEDLVAIAHREMGKAVSRKVMIIEDESIIAFDLESIVTEMGHRVTGVARTETSAIALANEEHPDLILSDIHLADGSSGIDAAAGIQDAIGPRPVIYITAYPERLLTGEGLEPAFLISKPYTEDQVRSAISQAIVFAAPDL